MDWVQIYAIVFATLLTMRVMKKVNEDGELGFVSGCIVWLLIITAYAPIFLRVWRVI